MKGGHQQDLSPMVLGKKMHVPHPQKHPEQSWQPISNGWFWFYCSLGLFPESDYLVFMCTSYICFPEHKESFGPIHWLFGHSALSTAAAMSMQKILLGLDSETVQGSGSFCEPLALFFQGLAHLRGRSWWLS